MNLRNQQKTKNFSSLLINLRPLLHEFHRLGFHAFLQGLLFRKFLAGGVVPDFLRDLHRAEMRAAHGTEVRELGAFLRQGFVVKFLRLFGVEAEVELVGPAEFEARLA